MHRISASIALLAVLIWVSGCSGGGAQTSVDPVSVPIESPQAPIVERSTEASSAVLWGYYDLLLDPDSLEITAVANRSLQFAVNVVPFLNPRPNGVLVSLNGSSPGPGYVDIDLDVTITHPLADEKFNGYDVRGIFIGNGSLSLAYNTDLIAANNDAEQVLINADGYTRWWNPTEFTEEGIMGYKPGKYASRGYTGTATLNPYRYFGEGLTRTGNLWSYLGGGGDTVGYFINGTSNTRSYFIRFPLPLPGIKYGYAVVASWAGGPPQYHPAHAVEAVGTQIEDFSTLYYVNETENGGYLEFNLGIFDWASELNGGVMEDYTVIVESTVLSGPHVFSTEEMTPVTSMDHAHIYHFKMPAENVSGTDGNEMWALVEYADADYTNPYGIPNSAGTDLLTAAFRYELDVSAESLEPSIAVTVPNGGEEWLVGTYQTIRWTSEYESGPVKIEYSKDDFVSDINVIDESAENDGEYDWGPVADDPSSTVKIRVSSVYDPTVFDTSDDYFSITECYVDITYPAGGEEIEAGTTLDAEYDYLNVGELMWLYSKDGFVSDFNIIGSQDVPTGVFQWAPVPPDPSETVSLRVFWTDQPSVSSTSEEFTIYMPTIEVTAPNGGERWGVGRTEEITWTSSHVTGTVDIQYSKDGFGSDVNDIAIGEEDDGSYTWADIPMDLTTQAEVRISSTDDPGIFDVSDDTFSIVDTGWAVSWLPADSTSNTVDSVTADSDGNIYVAGHSFPNGDGTLFVREYNRFGQLIWTRETGDPACTGMIANCIYVNDTDAVIAGRYRGSIDFYPEGAGGEHSTGGSYESFILLLTSIGEYADSASWAATHLEGMTVDELGDIYVCGAFFGTVDFDPDPIDTYELTSNGGADAWMSRFTSGLDHVSSCSWGGIYDDGASGMAYDFAGSVLYICGGFQGSNVDFDPGDGTALHSAVASIDSFLLKLQADNTYVDSVTWGGTAEDGALAVEISSLGYVYVGGIFAGTADFDWDPVAQDRRTALGSSDCYYVWCDTDLEYAGVSVIGSAGNNGFLDMVADSDGTLYCAGLFDGEEIDLDPGAGGDIRTKVGTKDLFIVALIPPGYYSWGHTIENGAVDAAYGGLGAFGSDFIVLGAGLNGADIELAPVEPPCNEASDTHGDPVSQACYILKYMQNGCWIN